MNNEKTTNALKKQKTTVLLLFFAKLPTLIALVALAVMSRSLILTVNALSSLTVVLQAWIIFVIAGKLVKNESHEYDYGMGKFESLGGFIINLFLYIGLIAIVISSVLILFEPSKPGDLLLFAVAVKMVDTATDVWLLLRQRKISKTASGKLTDAANHVMKDNLMFDSISLVAIAVLYLLREFTFAMYFEPMLCIAYSVYMMIFLIKPIKQCAYDLLDKTMDKNIQLKIMRAMTAGYGLYDTFQTVRTLSSGQVVYIDLLVGFKDEKTYAQIKEAFDELEKLVKTEVPNCVVSIVMTK